VARRPRTPVDPSIVVGYTRVSTAEQGDSGLGLTAQETAIRAECSRRGWTIAALHSDTLSGKTLVRPGLAEALEAVETGAAGGIIVAKLDRLSRSLVDFAGLMARAQAGGWNVVALDLGIDLATPAGEFMANVLASAAQWERRIIGQRTRDALAIKAAQGVRLGRPTTLAPDIAKRVVAAHASGAGWSTIARTLNAELVPTAHGGARWHPSTVRAVVLANQSAGT
jgi:DNA invertase Pin-like site-specific DNA recombinase